MSALTSAVGAAPLAAGALPGGTSPDAPATEAPADGGAPLDFQQLIGNLSAPTIAELLATAVSALPVTAEPVAGEITAGDTAAADGDTVTAGDGEADTSPDADQLNAALLALCNLQWPVNLPTGDGRGPVTVADADDPGAAAVAAAAKDAGLAVEFAAAVSQVPATAGAAGVPEAAAAAGSVRTASTGQGTPLAALAPLLLARDSGEPRAATEERAGDGNLPSAFFNQLVAVGGRSTAADAANGSFAQLLSAAPTVERATTVAGGEAQRTIDVPVRHPNWPAAVAAQVRWAANEQVQSATLKLVPEHLGPLEMRVEIRDNQVNVNFGATHVETRQALEQALPRLREIMAGAGLSLGQASVQQDAGRASQFAAGSSHLAPDEAQEEATVSTRLALGLVDIYA